MIEDEEEKEDEDEGKASGNDVKLLRKKRIMILVLPLLIVIGISVGVFLVFRENSVDGSGYNIVQYNKEDKGSLAVFYGIVFLETYGENAA